LVFLLVPLGAASATTAPDITTNVRVTLTNGEVAFDPSKLAPDTDTTFIVQVVNKGTKQRWFRLAGRQTPLLGHGAKQFFYYSFSFAGTIDWKSGGDGVKILRGEIHVHPAPALGVAGFG
jgi:hypothetical protein